tara:strand:- start:444 stop:587 length:144 start_codon:yes stop_codon:yes gene_type:complete
MDTPFTVTNDQPADTPARAAIDPGSTDLTIPLGGTDARGSIGIKAAS